MMLGVHPDNINSTATSTADDTNLHETGKMLTDVRSLKARGLTTPKHVDAVRDWTTKHYRDVNNHLRHGTPANNHVASTVKHLDQVISGAQIPHGVHVYRGVRRRNVDPLTSAKPGDVISSKGFTSTSLSPHKVTHFAKDDHIMHVELPQGSRALYASHPDLNIHTVEREVVLPRNAKMRYVGKSQMTLVNHNYSGDATGGQRQFTIHHLKLEE